MDASDPEFTRGDHRAVDVGPPRPAIPDTRSPFDRAVDACIGAGLTTAVLPIIPPDATVSEKPAPNRGKIPGERVTDGSWRGFKGWAQHITTPADIARWRTWPGAGLGVRTALLPAIDIDVEDPELAGRIIALARRWIGPGTLVRTRAGSPRVAILFRTTAPVHKLRMPFTLPGDGRRHAVDLLGTGQQLVLAGRHPSGAMYGMEGPGLVGRTLDSIPTLDNQGLENLITRINATISGAGGKAAQTARLTKARGIGQSLDPERALMRSVVGRRAEWVPPLLDWGPGPAERPWRITSGELGREDALSEDLCVYADGFYDFGTERPHSPISLIREFGGVAADGEIGFGGVPEYGRKDDHPYAVVGEPDPDVRRPTEAEAIGWLTRCLEGLVPPAGASREVMLAHLAGAVGLDWQALWAEHGRTFGLVPLDAAGDTIPEGPPAEWTRDDLIANASRVTAKHALDPAGFDRWCFGWEITGAARDDTELSALLADEERRARTGPSPDLAAAVPIPAKPDALSATPPGIRLVTGLLDPRGIPLRQHVIFPRCPCGDLLLTTAAPGMSKSTLGLHDALAIATGDERILRGENAASPGRLHRPGPVLIYDAEDPMHEMERRLAAAQQFHRVSTMPHTIALWSGVGGTALVIARRSRDKGALVEADGAALLRRTILSLGAVHVSVGPFAGLAEGMNANDAADCNTVTQILADIAARTGACINVVHHTSKGGGTDAGDTNAARGSSAIAAKVRSMITLTSLSEAEAQRYGVTARDHVAMTYAKVSHGRKPDGSIIFKRESVPVGNGCGFGPDPRDIFDLSAQQALQAAGDYAPVLRPVAVGSVPSREVVRGQRQIAVNDGAALAVLDALGGVGRRPLLDIVTAVTAGLNARGVLRGQARNTVRELLRERLAGAGRIVASDGQNVRVWMEKTGLRPNDPWIAVAEPAADAGGGQP